MKSMAQKMILISFILAAIAAMAVYAYLQSLEHPKAEIKETTILVAAETIPPRTLINKKMVKEMKVPDNSILADYIKDQSAVIGKYTKETILGNEGFHKDKLTSRDGDELCLKIDSDHRAISVNVTGDSGVSYLIKPGDFVDIIVYLAEKRDGDKIIRPDISKIMLQDIELLAIDKHLNRDENSKDKEERPTNFLVTLSVPVSQLEKLVLAESIGTLKLVLRPQNKENTGKTKGATWEALIEEGVSDTSRDISQSMQEGNAVSSSDSNEKYTYYTVKSGDTLIKISKAFYGDPGKYLVIKKANNIKDERLIITGERVRIPVLN